MRATRVDEKDGRDDEKQKKMRKKMIDDERG